jgi:hypothetical protein
MRQIFLLFSHQLTPYQKEDARASLNVKHFISLPDNLQKLWSHIPTDMQELSSYLNPLKEYLQQNAKKDDIVLVQGDFCAVYEMVNFCKSLQLIPVCCTTKREVKDVVQGDKVIKTSIFKHVIYRRY